MVSSCRSFLTRTDQNHKHVYHVNSSFICFFVHLTPSTNMHARYFNACLMILSKWGLDFKVLRKYLTMNKYFELIHVMDIIKLGFKKIVFAILGINTHRFIFAKKKTSEKDVLFKCYICLIICYWVHAMCCYKLSYVVFKGYVVLQIG